MEGYWDTKANELYYSQALPTRIWLNFKKVLSKKSFDDLYMSDRYYESTYTREDFKNQNLYDAYV